MESTANMLQKRFWKFSKVPQQFVLQQLKLSKLPLKEKAKYILNESKISKQIDLVNKMGTELLGIYLKANEHYNNQVAKIKKLIVGVQGRTFGFLHDFFSKSFSEQEKTATNYSIKSEIAEIRNILFEENTNTIIEAMDSSVIEPLASNMKEINERVRGFFGTVQVLNNSKNFFRDFNKYNRNLLSLLPNKTIENFEELYSNNSKSNEIQ